MPIILSLPPEPDSSPFDDATPRTIKVSEKTASVYAAYGHHCDTYGRLPELDDLAAATGLTATAVLWHVDNLLAKNAISWLGRRRAAATAPEKELPKPPPRIRPVAKPKPRRRPFMTRTKPDASWWRMIATLRACVKLRLATSAEIAAEAGHEANEEHEAVLQRLETGGFLERIGDRWKYLPNAK